MHHVADAVHVDDDVVLAVAVDDALELADHRIAATFEQRAARDDAHASPRSRARRRRPRIADRPWAAARRPSGGSAPSRRGRRRRWSSSPGSGAYSATRDAGLRRHQQRDAARLPELQVAVASRLTKVASTAASSGRNSSTMRVSPSWIVTSRSASEQLLVGLDRAAGHVDQPVALAADQAPAGAAEARIDAEDANRLSHRAPLIAPARAIPATCREYAVRTNSPPGCPVIDLPDLPALSAVMADPRFAARARHLGAVRRVRGFSGFGSALIYVPLMSALYGPQIGAASFLLIDFVTGIVFSIGVWRQAAWREVVPLAVAAVVRGAVRHADPAICRPGRACAGSWRRWCWWSSSCSRRAGAITASPLLIVTILVGLVGRRRSAARCRSPGRRW